MDVVACASEQNAESAISNYWVRSLSAVGCRRKRRREWERSITTGQSRQKLLRYCVGFSLASWYCWLAAALCIPLPLLSGGHHRTCTPADTRVNRVETESVCQKRMCCWVEEEEETRPRCMCGGLRGGGHGDWDECDCDEKGRAAVAVWRGYRDFFYETSYRLRAKAGHFFSLEIENSI